MQKIKYHPIIMRCSDPWCEKVLFVSPLAAYVLRQLIEIYLFV